MSTNLLTDSNLDLLIPSLIQASWHALAFCRTHGVRALGVARAHVLHVWAPEPPRRTAASPRPLWPSPLAASTPAPSRIAEPPWPPPGTPQRHHRKPPTAAAGLCHGRRRLSHSSPPAAPWSSSSLSWSPSARAHRRHVALRLQSDGRRCSYPRPPRDQPRTPI